MLKRVRASAVCVHAGALLCVRMRDPVSRIARLFVPGGQLEPAETAVVTAARETLEETGYEVAVDPSSEHVAIYTYVWATLNVECETHFFRARLVTPDVAPRPVRDADYHEGVVWLPLRALHELAFFTPIYSAVCSLLTEDELRVRVGTGS